MNFSEFNFHPDIVKGIKYAGFREPSPIQEAAIPLVLDGIDVVAQAHTGTGKTAAFGLPILDRLANGEVEKALIITPTRELATQISDELYYLGKSAGIRTLAVYGGVGYGRQIALINKGVDVVVATPGRLKDLYSKGKIESFNPEIVVLDEADEMLDMGFLDTIREIFDYIPQNRQTLLFSATMPEPIKDLADNILYQPQFISVIKENEDKTNHNIMQQYYVVDEEDRDRAIETLLETEDYKKALIFCRTKKEVDRLSEHLKALGFSAEGLHGDIEQIQRDEIVKSFRRYQTRILVATDVAARGLDFKDVTHVFNYHIPFDPNSYVHRIGRTARAGRSGKAVTIVSTLEFRELMRIKKAVGTEIELKTINLGAKNIEKDRLIDFVDSISLDDEVIKIAESLNDNERDTILKKSLTFIANYLKSTSQNILGYREDEVERFLKDYIKEEKLLKKRKAKKRN